MARAKRSASSAAQAQAARRAGQGVRAVGDERGTLPLGDGMRAVLAPTAPDMSAQGRVCETLGDDDKKCRALKRDNSAVVCGAPSGRGSPHDEYPGSRRLDPRLTCGTPLACRPARASPDGYRGARVAAGGVSVSAGVGAVGSRRLMNSASQMAASIPMAGIFMWKSTALASARASRATR